MYGLHFYWINRMPSIVILLSPWKRVVSMGYLLLIILSILRTTGASFFNLDNTGVCLCMYQYSEFFFRKPKLVGGSLSFVLASHLACRAGHGELHPSSSSPSSVPSCNLRDWRTCKSPGFTYTGFFRGIFRSSLIIYIWLICRYDGQDAQLPWLSPMLPHSMSQGSCSHKTNQCFLTCIFNIFASIFTRKSNNVGVFYIHVFIALESWIHSIMCTRVRRHFVPTYFLQFDQLFISSYWSDKYRSSVVISTVQCIHCLYWLYFARCNGVCWSRSLWMSGIFAF